MVNAAAGLTRMAWIRYTVAMIVGCLAWAAIYATVGIAAWEGSLALAARSRWALAATLALVAGVLIAAIVIRHRRAGRAVGNTVSPAATSSPASQ